jgi:hypothetical protein
MQGPYADHLLDANDTCSNCLRKNRVERVDPVMGTGLGHELDSHYSRDPRETTVEYHDGGTEPTRAKGVFCRCGVEGSHERYWSPTDVSRDRFKELLKNAVATLDRKGVTLRQKETIGYALSHFDDHGDVDRALATAIDAGIVAAAAGDGTERLRA